MSIGLSRRPEITGVACMPQKKPPSAVQQGISQRLRKLRIAMFGQRGASAFARALGISPISYSSYEKERTPSVHVLAAASKITGTELSWLITGQKRDGSAAEGIPVDRRELLEHIDRLAERNPAALRSVRAFLELLEEAMPGPRNRPSVLDERGGWLPVLGKSAAGVVFFWKDLPNGSGKSPADRLSELIDSYLKAQMAGAWMASIEETDGSGTEAAANDVNLIQVNVPSGAEVTEFLDCPAVRQRYPDAFALRIDGDSMIPQLVHGDMAIVSPSVPAVDGKPAVVQLKGQVGVTCKLYRREGDKVHLIPANENMPAQSFEISQVEWALRVLFRVRINRE